MAAAEEEAVVEDLVGEEDHLAAVAELVGAWPVLVACAVQELPEQEVLDLAVPVLVEHVLVVLVQELLV